MGATSLKRKARKNRVVSKRRQQAIKLNTAKPVIKKVDVEKLKEEFTGKSKGKAEKKEAKAAEVEAKVEETKPQETAAKEKPAKEAPKASKKKEDKEDKE